MITVATITRVALYRAVWSEPVHAVAARYGLSDVGLAKLCRRHRIPLPGRGYWQRLRAGRRPKRQQLSPLRQGEREEIFVARGRGDNAHAMSDDAAILVRAEHMVEHRIVVAGVLTDLHPKVKMAERSLRSASAGEHNILRPRAKHRLDIRVTRQTLDRALRIMDALLKALEARGYAVAISESEPAITSARVLEEELQFFIEEPIQHAEHKPTPQEKLEAALHPWIRWPPYDSAPSGSLQLRIANANRLGVRQTWADGAKQRLEGCLNKFAEGLVRAAAATKVERARREQLHRKWEEEERRRAERQRLRWQEEQRAHELERQVGRWRKGREMREYLETLKQAESLDLPSDLGIESLQDWVAWATAYAARLDPLAQGSVSL
jgi:hypothetical protein